MSNLLLTALMVVSALISFCLGMLSLNIVVTVFALLEPGTWALLAVTIPGSLGFGLLARTCYRALLRRTRDDT